MNTPKCRAAIASNIYKGKTTRFYLCHEKHNTVSKVTLAKINK